MATIEKEGNDGAAETEPSAAEVQKQVEKTLDNIRLACHRDLRCLSLLPHYFSDFPNTATGLAGKADAVFLIASSVPAAKWEELKGKVLTEDIASAVQQKVEDYIRKAFKSSLDSRDAYNSYGGDEPKLEHLDRSFLLSNIQLDPERQAALAAEIKAALPVFLKRNESRHSWSALNRLMQFTLQSPLTQEEYRVAGRAAVFEIFADIQTAGYHAHANQAVNLVTELKLEVDDEMHTQAVHTLSCCMRRDPEQNQLYTDAFHITPAELKTAATEWLRRQLKWCRDHNRPYESYPSWRDFVATYQPDLSLIRTEAEAGVAASIKAGQGTAARELMNIFHLDASAVANLPVRELAAVIVTEMKARDASEAKNEWEDGVQILEPDPAETWQNLIPEEAFFAATKQQAINYLTSDQDHVRWTYGMRTESPYLAKLVADPDVRAAAQAGICALIANGEAWSAETIATGFDFDLSAPLFQVAAMTGLRKLTSDEDGISQLDRHLRICKIDPAILKSDEFRTRLCAIAAKRLLSSTKQYLRYTLDFCEQLAVRTTEDVRGRVPALEWFLDRSQAKTLPELAAYIVAHASLAKYAACTPSEPIRLTDTDYERAKTTHLRLEEIEQLLRAGVQPGTLSETLTALHTHSPSWQDEENIWQPFQAGAAVFGAPAMLAYCDRDSLTRHDALYAFPSIIKLQEASTLGPTVFNRQILAQVAGTNRPFDEGSAQQHLNAVAGSLNLDFATVRMQADRWAETIPEVGSLSATYTTPGDIFRSANDLFRYANLAQKVASGEALQALEGLKTAGRQDLYDFGVALALRPESKVNMDDALAYCSQDEKVVAGFLGRDDISNAGKHELKKPTNYIELPCMDLSALELRDASLNGTLDRLQTIRPMRVRYVTWRTNDGRVLLSPREIVRAAVGRRGKGGLAQNPQGLFAKVKKAFGRHAIERWLQAEREEAIPESLAAQIVSLAEAHGVVLKRQEFIAAIHPKSAVDGIIAGNDTNTCMPFGSGKNTIYTFNLGTAIFTLQMEREEGNPRTIAQSLMSKDADIGRPIDDVYKEMNELNKPLRDVVAPEALRDAPRVLAADNVEVAANYTDAGTLALTTALYRDFFARYMEWRGAAEGYDPKHVAIGLGHSDALLELPRRPNHFVPLAPIAYTDKFGANVGDLKLDEPRPALPATVEFQDGQPPRPLLPSDGLASLTFEDAWPPPITKVKSTVIIRRSSSTSTTSRTSSLPKILPTPFINNPTSRLSTARTVAWSVIFSPTTAKFKSATCKAHRTCATGRAVRSSTSPISPPINRGPAWRCLSSCSRSTKSTTSGRGNSRPSTSKPARRRPTKFSPASCSNAGRRTWRPKA